MFWQTDSKVTVSENMEAIYYIILDDRRISAKKITETLAISRERVGRIIDGILYMRKLSDNFFFSLFATCRDTFRNIQQMVCWEARAGIGVLCNTPP
jgi:hypothetical protein